jgi:hypothetical protein
VWPSVVNDDPTRSDTRMFHEAKEVLKGVKYAANHWSELLFHHRCRFEVHVVLVRVESSMLIIRMFFH